MGMGMDLASDLAVEVQELAWALVDDQATEREMLRLEELLLENAEARQNYVTCIQMLSDLHYLLSGKRPPLPTAVEKAVELQKTKTVENVGPARKPRRSAAPLPIVNMPIIVDQYIPIM